MKYFKSNFPVVVAILIFLGGILTLESCYYDVEEELYPMIGCDTLNVTYNGTVLPILVNNCYECHKASSNFGNITLEGYDNLMILVNNGEFVGAVTHAPGFSPMPKNRGKLLECEIEKILKWVNLGAPNN